MTKDADIIEEDPLEELAENLEEAASSIDETLLEEGNELKEFAAKTVYSTFYYFSYGVCFVGLLAGKVIPKTGLIGQGLRDGAAAARDSVERITTKPDAISEGFGESISLEEDEESEPEPVKKPVAKRTRARKATA